MRRKPVAVPQDHRLQEVQGAGRRQDLRLQEDQDAPESSKIVFDTLLYISNSHCHLYQLDAKLEHLSLGFYLGQTDSCQGDSGGPLYVFVGNTHHISLPNHFVRAVILESVVRGKLINP